MSDKLAALGAACRKEHGEGSFQMASDSRATNIPRISTGVFVLDYATGGGIPIGRTTMVYGKKSAGKSYLLAKITAEAQKKCRKCRGPLVYETKKVQQKIKRANAKGEVVADIIEIEKSVPVDCVNRCRVEKVDGEKKTKVFPGRMNVVWIDSEGTYSNEFYADFGVDNGDVFLVVTDYSEQAIDIADAAIRTGECDLLIVDSIAHLVPKAEREKSAEDQLVGVHAKLINRAMRQWTASMNELEAKNELECTVLLTNQLRVKVGLFPVEVKPGGMGQEFATSVEVKLKQKSFQFDSDGRPLWQVSEFTVEKNKCGTPKISGMYQMCLTRHPGRKCGDTWDDLAVLEHGKRTELITGRKHVMLFEKEYPSEDAVLEALRADPKLLETLRSRALEIMVTSPSSGELKAKKKDDDKE